MQLSEKNLLSFSSFLLFQKKALCVLFLTAEGVAVVDSGGVVVARGVVVGERVTWLPPQTDETYPNCQVEGASRAFRRTKMRRSVKLLFPSRISLSLFFSSSLPRTCSRVSFACVHAKQPHSSLSRRGYS